jgi:hypothetical protein
MAKAVCIEHKGGKCVRWRIGGATVTLAGLGGPRASRRAQSCVSREIAKHCRKKRGKGCKIPSVSKQAQAIAYSICRRKGFRSIAAR